MTCFVEAADLVCQLIDEFLVLLKNFAGDLLQLIGSGDVGLDTQWIVTGVLRDLRRCPGRQEDGAVPA